MKAQRGNRGIDLFVTYPQS